MKISSNNQNQNKLNFKANIEIVAAKAEFERLPLNFLKDGGQYVGYPWTIYQSAKFLKEGFTDNASVCTEGFIQNGKNGFIFHLQPENSANSNATIARKFKDAADQLKNQNGELSAFLTGGNPLYGESWKLYEFITKLLRDDFKIPFSSIWGHRKSENTDLYASALSQRYVVCANWERKPLAWQRELHKDYFEPEEIRSIKDLKKVYEDVIIDKNDIVIFR